MTTQLVVARHPVPVRFTPRSGKHERTGYVMASTPVPLREVDPAGVADLMTWRNPRGWSNALVGLEGGLWLRPGMRSAADIGPGTAEAFLRDLREGTSQGFDLQGTPIQADSSVTGQSGSVPFVDAAKRIPGAILESYEAEARAALLRFFERDVALAGDVVLFRARPLAKFILSQAAHLELQSGAMPDMLPCGRIDRFEEDSLSLCGPHATVVPEPLLLEAAAAAAGRLSGNEDLRHYANRLPGQLWKMFADHNPKASEAHRAGGSTVRRFAALGSIGAVDEPDYGAALRAASRFHDEVCIPCVSNGKDLHRYAAFSKLAERHVLPRLAQAPDAPLDPQDAEALSTLGM